MRSGTFHAGWGGLAPAPSFLRVALAVFVATVVGAVSGVAVVLSLLDVPTPETQPIAMLTKKTIDLAQDANAGIRREGPQPTLGSEVNYSSAVLSTDKPLLRNTTIATNQPAPVPGETVSDAVVTPTSSSARKYEQTRFDPRQRRFAVHHRRFYSRRFANMFGNLPLPRFW